jgi:hypothetical protein
VGESEEEGSQEDEDQQKSEAGSFGSGPLAIGARRHPEDGDDGKNERGDQEEGDQFVVCYIEV